MDKNALKTILQKHVVKVNFTKLDGTLRTMVCTLREDTVKPHVKKTERVKKPKDDILSVWDIEKDAFRSIKLDSLIDYTVLKEGYEL